MNVLIVSAHPDPTSLTNALRDVAAGQLRAVGHNVRLTDLYADRWKPTVDRFDFPALPASARLRVPIASGEAYATGTLTDDVKDEQAKLLWADALILAFPLWWFSMPAILKGWVDRVYAFGFAYGVGEHSETRRGDRYGEGTLAGRRAMLLVTAGGWDTHYGPRGINGPIDDLLFPIHHGILFYPGYEVLPPFVVYRADRMNDDAFAAAVERQSGCDSRGDQDETDRVAAVVIMAAFVATVQAVSIGCVAARQSAEFLIVARVGGRPGPRLRSNATRRR